MSKMYMLSQPTLGLISKQGLVTEANVTKYACWKTHQETRGLALRFNDLVIRYQTSSPALAVCVDFLHAVATKYHPFIKRNHFRQYRALYRKNPGEVLPDNFRFVLMNGIEGMVDRNEGIPELWSAQAWEIRENGC
jgi:hypothetical protein